MTESSGNLNYVQLQEVVTRAEARARGLKRYFTGEPCRRGHITDRYTRARKCLECDRIWREANRDKTRKNARKWREENSRKWREANLDRVREANRRWLKANPEKSIVISHRKRARRRSANGSHTATDLRVILEKQSHKCVYCRVSLRKTKKHLDHIVALVRGGTNDKRNLQFLCMSCNCSKGAKDPIQFAQEKGLLL